MEDFNLLGVSKMESVDRALRSCTICLSVCPSCLITLTHKSIVPPNPRSAETKGRENEGKKNITSPQLDLIKAEKAENGK